MPLTIQNVDVYRIIAYLQHKGLRAIKGSKGAFEYQERDFSAIMSTLWWENNPPDQNIVNSGYTALYKEVQTVLAELVNYHWTADR